MYIYTCVCVCVCMWWSEKNRWCLSTAVIHVLFETEFLIRLELSEKPALAAEHTSLCSHHRNNKSTVLHLALSIYFTYIYLVWGRHMPQHT